MNIKQLISSIRPMDFGDLPERSFGVEFTEEEALELLFALAKAREPRFTLSPGETDTYTKALAWLIGSPECTTPRGGLYIWGPPGTGKTLLASLLLEMSQLLQICRPFWRLCTPEGFSGREGWTCLDLPLLWEHRHAKEFVSHYIKTGQFLGENDPVLFIEDMGVESLDAMHFGSRCEVLPSLLSDRLDRHAERYSLPVIITTNVRPEGLEAKYGDRTASRLRGSCLFLELTTRDHRCDCITNTKN